MSLSVDTASLRGQGRIIGTAERDVKRKATGRWVGGILLPGLLVLMSAAPAAPAQQRSGPSFSVDVKVEAPGATVHRGLRFAQIRSLTDNKNSVGFTLMPLTLAIEINSTMVSGPRRDLSFYVSDVQITLRYDAIDVYVASEFRQEPCIFQAMIEHEHEHIGVDQKLARDYALRMKAAVEKAPLPTYLNPLEGISLSKGRALAKAQVKEILDPLMAELLAKRKEASAELDQRESFDLIRDHCRRD